VINGLHIQDEKYSIANPIETMTTNAVFTSILMDNLRKSDFNGTLLHLGTAKIYGVKSSQTIDIKPTTENRPPEPVGMKAVSRYVQENIVTGMAKTYGIPYIVFRLGTVYGIFTPRDMVLNTWIRDILLQNNLKLHGKGHESRDFTHVYDIAELVTRLVNKNKYHGITNEIYNIGSSNKYETRLGNVADAILGFLRPHSPDSKVMKTDYIDEADKDYREFLDCSKAEKQLKYYPFVGFDAIKLLMGNVPYIAKYELGFGEKEMLEINTLCNRFDHQNRIKVAKQAGLDLNTKEGQEYIEKQVEAITARSENVRTTSAQEILEDPKSETAQRLKKFMEDNNLSPSDVGQIIR
jgi:nucleoside-diphosphate-sugar epimerase